MPLRASEDLESAQAEKFTPLAKELEMVSPDSCEKRRPHTGQTTYSQNEPDDDGKTNKGKHVTKARNKAVTPAHRAPALRDLRNRKMARSAHAYVRGNTERFYEWLLEQDASSVPEGPAIWICGDCHMGNLGPVADDRGGVHIQIRDFDQSVIGNPAHDLIRLGLSLAMAARGSDLPGLTTVRVLEALLIGYEAAFPDSDEEEPSIPDAMQTVMKRALRRNWKSLAHERIDGVEPSFPTGRNFWPLTQRERDAIKRLFASPDMVELATQLHHRDSDGHVELLDAAYWRKGCSSLGKRRYAVLLDIDGEVSDGEDLCLIDIKEAVASVTPRARGARMPRDNAKRVVLAATHLSPALGQRMRAASLLGNEVFVRELLPQDLKIDIERMGRKQATRVAMFLANVVGRAHSRQLDVATRKAWRNELARNHTRTLDAPSWLWRSVTGLLAYHEKQYLDHCRTYVAADSR